jgi:flagellar biosynthesis/type III secretory pathway protein FliH
MGRVIKGLGHRVPGVLLDAEAQAAALLATARADADRLRVDAQTAFEQTRQRGYADGRDAAATEVLSIVLAARAEQQQALTAASPMAVSLAARMAAKIVGHAVETAPALMAEIAGQALSAGRARAGRVKLRVHPADRAALVAASPTLAARLSAGAALELVDDPTVGRYGCIVETNAGRLDARLETQLALLEKALRGEPAHD